ncbi:MAG TPA: carboxypeptidase regulatory-like domain-containing protein [Thermoanaerobaculia bacterium]|nr:carboxypeptidase regulatory-like domain-containing protein [Thermoanaerobaculia bacterium]
MAGETTWETVRHRAAIAGRVTDAGTGKPLPGARIEITAGPPELTSRLALLALQYGSRWASLAERADRTRAAGDGFFRFLDLPAGKYTLTASLPGSGSRYGTASVEVTLTADGEGRVALATASLALPATTIKGRISDATAAIRMAEVRIQGSGERAWSDAQGNYALSGIEAGARKLTISASGFQAKSETVTLGTPGEVATRDVTLSPP